MKRYIFAFTALLICSFLIVACAPEKKNKLNNSTIIVKIDPVSVSMLNTGQQVVLKAIITDPSGKEMEDAPVSWSVVNSTNPTESLGDFTDYTAKITTFTASSNKGRGDIVLECAGITKKLGISVNTAAVKKITIEIDNAVLKHGEHTWVKAKVFDTDDKDITSEAPTIEWYVNDKKTSDFLGSFSPAIGSSVTFVATNNAVFSGIASIKALCTGIYSEVKEIGVNDVPFAGWYLYTDAGLGVQVADVHTWQDGYGSTVDLKGGEAGVTGVPKSYTDPIDDHIVGFRLIYTAGNGSQTLRWAGFSLPLKAEYQVAGNFKNFTKVCFWAKGAVGGETFNVKPGNVGDTGVSPNVQKVTLTNDWAYYQIPFVGVNMSATFTGAVAFVFEDKQAASVSCTVYIDYITVQ